MATDHAVEVRASDQVNEARRVAASLARRCGLGEEDAGRVALVATEAATNLVKHGGGGQVLVSALASGERRGIRIVAIDRGRGIPELERSRRDGISSTGSPGTGLGAMARMSDTFDVWSRADQGTVLMSHVWSRGRGEPPRFTDDATYGGVSVPLHGEEVCGDDWTTIDQNGTRTTLVTDGLGHGPAAGEASACAKEIFTRTAGRKPAEIVEMLNEGLRPTRGAAVAVVRIDSGRSDLTFCGVGNIAGCIVGDERPRNLVSHHGTAGHDVRRIQEFEYPFPPGSTLILNTDGLVSHWDLKPYAGLMQRHPTVIASVLYRDFARDRDDATAVVVRRRT